MKLPVCRTHLVAESPRLGAITRPKYANFGGVPELTGPDRLKAGVRPACYYDPDVNPPFSISPCITGRPFCRPGCQSSETNSRTCKRRSHRNINNHHSGADAFSAVPRSPFWGVIHRRDGLLRRSPGTKKRTALWGVWVGSSQIRVELFAMREGGVRSGTLSVESNV